MGKLTLKPSEEEKAFVYQQTMELSPLIMSKEPIAVVLQKTSAKTYKVTFVLLPKSLNMQIHSEGGNLFDVCIAAKNKAKKAMAHLINGLDFPHRKTHIAHLKKFPYLQ